MKIKWMVSLKTIRERNEITILEVTWIVEVTSHKNMVGCQNMDVV